MKFTFQFAILALFSASAFALPSQLESRQDIKSQALSLHNDARAKYGAAPLTWNDQIAGQVRDYANKCVFQHSGDKGVGENLGAGTGDYSIADAVNGWMAESSKYDYNHPGFSAATGHFTQVVWKSTKQVACAVANCKAGTIFDQPSKFVVCQYTPPGNFQGQFPANVGKPK